METTYETYDVIIVGTGLAGIFCSLNLSSHLKVLVITKQKIKDSNSFLAQGGISVLKSKEDFKGYMQDTLKAGKYENNQNAVEVMINQSREVIDDLENLGVEFDKKDGEFLYTREAAHSVSRILHHKDITGEEIMTKLITKACQRSNITFKEYCTMVDIIQDKKTCVGIKVYKNGAVKNIYSKAVVLATGGIGGLFSSSTNYKHITGDGVAIALKNNIPIKNINYIQIHPTTLYIPQKGRKFLISEAVRGEGAYLLNYKKQRFVDELLPRDIVSNIIAKEMNKHKSPNVYLDIRHLGEKKIKQRFPNIYKRCLEEGYDIISELLPVSPAQHYFIGGIEVDIEGRTSLKGLFALGETSSTGVHGANRLASNSLLEAAVFAKKAADVLNTEISNNKYNNIAMFFPPKESLDLSKVEKINKKIILEEIKRKDDIFYAKWCKYECQCG